MKALTELRRRIAQMKAEVATYRPISHLVPEAYEARAAELAALYERMHAVLQP